MKTVVYIIDGCRIEMWGGTEWVRHVESREGMVDRTFKDGVLTLDELRRLLDRKKFGTWLWMIANTQGRQGVLDILEET
jgi:hypothetical protein